MSIQNRDSPSWLIPLLLALAAATVACSLLTPLLGTPPAPTTTATLVRRPTNTMTGTPTQSPTPTVSPTPSFTLSPSITWTTTASPTVTPRPTRTNTPSRTPVPPTFTPGPNQITKGYDVWQLTESELRRTAKFLDTPITPQQYNRAPGGYVFLVLDFECVTGPSLITLMDLKEYGLTFVHRKDGYPDIWLEDENQEIYRVNMIATCWLAAVVPPDIEYVRLYFNGFIFQPTLPIVKVEE